MARSPAENPARPEETAAGGKTAGAARPRKVSIQAVDAASSGPSTVEALFKMVVEQSRSLLSTYDLEGTFLYANRAFTRSLGYRVDEILGRKIFSLIHPDDLAATQAAFASVLAGETVRDFEMRVLDREGQPVHLLGSGSAIRDESGKPVAVCAMATDVTEVRRLEEEIRAQRSYLQDILDHSDFFFASFDLDGQISTWNRTCEEMTGVDRIEARGRSFFDLLVRSDAREDLRERVNGLLEGLKARECEAPIPAERGEERYVSWNFFLRRSPHDRVNGFVAMGRETTESREAARETMRARETLENILQSLSSGLLVVNAAGETTYWNRRMEDLTGIPWTDVINRRTDETFPWLFRGGFTQAREGVLSGRIAAHESPPLGLETPGGRVSVIVRAIPYRSADGAIAGTIVRIEDVTESLRLRADLAHSERRYKNLVQSAKDCIHVLDPSGRFLELNASGLAFCELRDPSLIIGKRYDEVVDPESQAVVLAALEKARSGASAEFEYSFTSPSGRRILCSSVLTPVLDARGRLQSLLGISRDITDRKRLEEELREKNGRLVHAFERLERLAALKDEFLSNVSHELRTPLTSIRSYTEILLNYPDEDQSVQREFLGIINEECQRLTNLLNDVLDLSKIEAGEMAWHVAPHTVGDFIHPAVEVSRALALGAGVAIETTIADGLPAVTVDEDRFQQVVLNILSNAIKHSPKGGTVRVGAERTVAGPGGSDAILIQIADEGSGIAPEDVPHLFDKYFQTKAATRRRGGTGLGLAISREIVEAFGGRIWAESEPGRGSVFRFTIPRETASPHAG